MNGQMNGTLKRQVSRAGLVVAWFGHSSGLVMYLTGHGNPAGYLMALALVVVGYGLFIFWWE